MIFCKKFIFGGDFMKKILILLAALLIVPMSVGAENTDYSTEKITNVEKVEDKTETKTDAPTTTNKDTTTPDVIDPDMTVDVVGNRILKKLYQIADLLKKIAAPISIIMFIVGAILMVTGALGKRDGAKQGIIVCLLSVVTYAVCMYSEPIVLALSNWLIS